MEIIRLILNLIIPLLGALILLLNYGGKKKNVFSSNNKKYVFVCGIIIILSTVISTYLTHLIDQENETKQQTLNEALQGEVTKNRLISESNFHLNKFLGELDNKIEELYLIVDFDRSYSAEELNGFECYLKMDALNSSYFFKLTDAQIKMPENTRMISLSKVSVKNCKWNSDPSIVNVFSPRTETSFLDFDLWFMLKQKPINMLIKNLNQSYWEIAVNSRFTKMIKQIQINVNDWTIYNRIGNQLKWEEREINWIPQKNSKYSIMFEENDFGMRYYQRKINYMKEGIFYYTVSFLEEM